MAAATLVCAGLFDRLLSKTPAPTSVAAATGCGAQWLSALLWKLPMDMKEVCCLAAVVPVARRHTSLLCSRGALQPAMLRAVITVCLGLQS